LSVRKSSTPCKQLSNTFLSISNRVTSLSIQSASATLFIVSNKKFNPWKQLSNTFLSISNRVTSLSIQSASATLFIVSKKKFNPLQTTFKHLSFYFK